jgi:hypothetical protein
LRAVCTSENGFSQTSLKIFMALSCHLWLILLNHPIWRFYAKAVQAKAAQFTEAISQRTAQRPTKAARQRCQAMTSMERARIRVTIAYAAPITRIT